MLTQWAARGVVALDLVARVRALTFDIRRLETEIAERTTKVAPESLRVTAWRPCRRPRSSARSPGWCAFAHRHAFARHNGTAPPPVWSGNRCRHRLSRSGNRQLNAALHRIAVTQARAFPDAIAYLERRQAGGDTRTEALRALERRLSDVVFRAPVADAAPMLTEGAAVTS